MIGALFPYSQHHKGPYYADWCDVSKVSCSRNNNTTRVSTPGIEPSTFQLEGWCPDHLGMLACAQTWMHAHAHALAHTDATHAHIHTTPAHTHAHAHTHNTCTHTYTHTHTHARKHIGSENLNICWPGAMCDPFLYSMQCSCHQLLDNWITVIKPWTNDQCTLTHYSHVDYTIYIRYHVKIAENNSNKWCRRVLYRKTENMIVFSDG